MNRRTFYLSSLILASSLLIACQNSSEKQHTSDQTVKHESPSKNEPYSPSIPSNLSTEELKKYVITNFWKDYDFKDISKLQNGYAEQTIVDFISVFIPNSNEFVENAFDNFFELAKQNNSPIEYYTQQFDRYLYDGNSPLYNDLYYEEYLKSAIKSKLLSDKEETIYKTKLNLVSKNQQGNKATDFKFLTDQGPQSLYNLKAENTILFFYQPGCQSCAATIEFFKNSAKLNLLIANNNLTLLAIYPDGNEEIWKDYSINIPKNWINALDNSTEILQKGLYDLKSSPTIYLLDKEKKVIFKDIQAEKLLSVLSQ